MDCAGIQELLSEYIDGTLDTNAVQVVEKHVSVCEDCKETLASLRAMVEELNALEPIKAPADFLEKIHQRMVPRSYFRRLFIKLFVPFKIKIPLQLAAAATASILVVMVLNIQKSEYQKIQPLKTSKSEWFAEKPDADHLTPELKKKKKHTAPVLEEVPGRLSDSEQGMPAQRSRLKTLARPSIQRKSEPSSSISTTARPSTGKGQPIKLALMLNPVVLSRSYESDMAMQTTPYAGSDKKAMEKKRTEKDFLEEKMEVGQRNQANDLLLRMNRITRSLKGSILAKKYHNQNNRLTSIHVQIPAENYASFCRELSRLGTFKTPPPVLSGKDLKKVDLLINLTYPE